MMKFKRSELEHVAFQRNQKLAGGSEHKWKLKIKKSEIKHLWSSFCERERLYTSAGLNQEKQTHVE